MTQVAPPSAAPKNDGLAIASLVCGILGFVCCGIFAAIPAIILGMMAKKRIAASGGTVGGEGLAKIGIILGIVGCVLFVIMCLLAVFGVFNFFTAFSQMSSHQ